MCQEENSVKRSLVLLAVFLAVAMVVTACGGKKASPTPLPAGAQTPAATRPAAQPTTARQEPQATSAVATSPAPQPAEEELPTGQSLLRSYVQLMEFKEEVIKPEPSLRSWGQVELRVQREPAPGRMAITVTDKSGEHPETQTRMIFVEDAIYIFNPAENLWTKMTRQVSGDKPATTGAMDFAGKLAQESPAGLFTPAHVVSRHEKLEGVDTTHYRFADKDLEQSWRGWFASEGKLISGQIELWIANKGNYLKKYRQDTVFEEEDGTQVRQQYEALITQENKPVEIELPPADQIREMEIPAFPVPGAQGTREAGEEAQTGAEPISPEAKALFEALPPPPDSTEIAVEELPETIKFMYTVMGEGRPARAYRSSASLADIQAFYKEQFNQAGLVSFTDQMGGKPGEMKSNLYVGEKASIQLILDADPDTGETLVLLILLS